MNNKVSLELDILLANLTSLEKYLRRSSSPNKRNSKPIYPNTKLSVLAFFSKIAFYAPELKAQIKCKRQRQSVKIISKNGFRNYDGRYNFYRNS